jgi:hypothetical protein
MIWREIQEMEEVEKRNYKKTTVVLGITLAITLCFLVVVSTLYFVLEIRLRNLEALTEMLREYFFFQDGKFLNDGSWSLYNYSVPDPFNVVETFQKYTNQCANGFYNITDGDGDWAGAQFLQGKLPHCWRVWGSILGGASFESAKPVNGVTFYRRFPIPENKFFFNAKVKVLQRNYTTFGSNEWAYANIAPQFTFAYDDKNYDDPDKWSRVAINVEIILSQAKWDKETKTLTHTDNAKWIFESPWDGDYHICIVVGKITELNKWYVFKVDMKNVIATVFEFVPAQKITFKCIIIGNDGCSSYSETIYEYAYMSVEN